MAWAAPAAELEACSGVSARTWATVDRAMPERSIGRWVPGEWFQGLRRVLRVLSGLLVWLALAAGALPAAAGELRAGELASTALGAPMRYQVYLPDAYALDPQARFPVVYLLHGHGGDEFDWLRHGRLADTADRLIRSGAVAPFIAVMPAGGDSWWIDSAASRAQTALVHELPSHIEARFRAMPAREGRAVMGLSAGGYGAVMAGLQQADRYAAVAAFSPAVYDPQPPAHSAARQVPAFRREGAFDPATWTQLGVARAWDTYVARGIRLPFFLLSGDTDDLGITPQTSALQARLFALQPTQVAYRVVSGGHDWAVWRDGLGEALAFLARHFSAPVGPANAQAPTPGGAGHAAAAAAAGAGSNAAAGAAAAPPAQLRLAAIFGDRMVLQRDQPLRVWGEAPAGQQVQVDFRGVRREARADARGRWQVMLPPGPAGGPHVLAVSTDAQRLQLRDVMLGDVWLCAGQSNMEWSVAQARDGPAEVAGTDRPLIRHVRVPHRVALQPLEAEPAPLSWKVSHPATAGEFSAVGYFFARRMQRELGVPIGLVNVAWGGSILETWISREGMAGDVELSPAAQDFPRSEAAWREQRTQREAALLQRWQPGLPGATEPPLHWAQPTEDDRRWPRLQVPGLWEEQGLPGFDGHVWYRLRLTLTAEQAAAGPAVLHLGPIDDCDETWLNGQRLGQTCGWDSPRRYAVPAGLLHPGEQVLAIRVRDTGGGGGPHGRAESFRLEGPGWSVPLAGSWAARIESSLAAKSPGVNDGPALAFEGMVRALTPLPIRGVLWYQGESNVPRAAQYARSLPLFIADWRRHWQQPALPFHVVQLASYLPEARNTLTGSAWAELREAQRQVLAVPHTGLVVATDLGDPDDIHPANKQDVGERLAASSLRRDFGREVVASGPVWTGVMRRVGAAKGIAPDAGGASPAALRLTFRETTGGLAVRGPGASLEGFAVAGADRRFHPAQARIEGAQVRVWSAEVPAPVAVRYGWVDNPQRSNLVNRAGWPASPFRTDDWPLITEGVRWMP